ncbi:MAG: cyanophycinase [Bacteroidales bacterium]|jgi:cyanophycinase|nr:cyanophycinase [Bacteroidales bacterium]
MKNFILLVFIGSLFLFVGCNNVVQHKSISQIEPSLGPENGRLLIIGGAARDPLFLEIFKEYAGGADAKIIVIPTAYEDKQIEKDTGFVRLKSTFERAGFSNIHILHTRDSNIANTEEFVAPIREANGVYFMGGRQWRIADGFLNTLAHDEFNKLLARGGIIAGSSAGATIQGSYLARGDTKKNTIMLGDHEVGLGFMKNVAIDQHILARNRQFDLFEILDQHPQLLGIGLDENTGILVDHDKFEVVGKHYVAILDGTRWSRERDTIYQLSANSREFYFLKSGDKYDLQNRKVLVENQSN